MEGEIYTSHLSDSSILDILALITDERTDRLTNKSLGRSTNHRYLQTV